VHRFAQTAFAVITALAAARAVASGSPGGPVDAIACAPSNPEAAGAVVRDTVWLTRDGGETWRAARRLKWDAPDLSEPSEDTDSSEDSDSSGVSPPLTLAVGDRGEWAVARGARWISCFDGSVRRSAERAEVLGLAFDRAGRLWIAAGDILEVAQRAASPHAVALAGAGAPVPGADDDAVIVPGARGTFEARVHESGTISLRSRGRPAESAAVEPLSGRIFAAASGSIFADDAPAPIARAPLPARRLLASPGGRFWALSRKNWYAISRTGGLSRLEERAIAVDAAGRVWRGSESGPRSPDEGRRAPIAPLVGGSGTFLFDFAPETPPPCRRPIAALLPDASLAFSFDRGASISRGADGRAESAEERARVYFGASLTWELGAGDDAACAARRERHLERESRRFERLLELRDRRAAAETEAITAETIEAAIAAETDGEAAAALARAAGGPLRKQGEEERK
jgi:hypothetical protein